MRLPLATAEFDRSGNHLTVYLSGELDEESAPALTGSIIRHVQPTLEEVWLDLSSVSFCGSAGITMLMHVAAHADDCEARFTLYEPQPNVASVLQMCHLDEVLRVWSRKPRPARA